MSTMIGERQAVAAQRPLAGRTAVVTGSTSGIGLGVARALAGAGANVLLNGFGPASEIDQIRRELEEGFAVGVRHSAADMSRPAEIETMLAEAERDLGSVDILVNNAGIQHVAPIETFPPAKWDAILAINLSAAFHTSRAGLPGHEGQGLGPHRQRRLGARPRGLALQGGLCRGASMASSASPRSPRSRLAETGITANAICPGYVWTPLVEQPDRRPGEDATASRASRSSATSSWPSSRASASPRSRSSAPSRSFSAARRAASITGTALPVDGGWTAH